MNSSRGSQQPRSDSDRADLGLVGAVRTQFSFLADMGFRERTAQPTFLRFDAEGVFVEVYHGRRSYELGVEVGRSVDVDGDVVEQKFHLSDIVAILAPGQRYRPMTAQNSRQVAQFVEELARWTEVLMVRIMQDKDTIFAELSEGLERRSDEYLHGVAADRLRRLAASAWRARDLASVINAYEEIESELRSVELSESEKRRLKYAREHLNRDEGP